MKILLNPLYTSFKSNINSPQAPSQKQVAFGSLEQSKFDRIFPIFLNNTDEKDQMTDAMRPVFKKLQSHNWWNNKSGIKVLDIGCGDGSTSTKIYSMIQGFFPTSKFNVSAFDNNPNQLADYSRRFSTAGNTSVKTHHLDAFIHAFAKNDADLVIASHSLYHAPVDQLDKIIPNLYNSLSSQGIGMISLLNDNSDFAVIQKRFGSYVTSPEETNPVGVGFDDITGVIDKNPLLRKNSMIKPYEAYVYFPKIKNGFEEFKHWQLKEPNKPAPNPECQTTLDLLEFIVHGDFSKLRHANKLEPFLKTIETMFQNNGLDSQGRQRINFNGENLFLLGSDTIHAVK